MSSRDETILITGATDGLGRAVARRVARSGTTLLLHGRDVSRGEETAREASEAGATAKFLRADFASLAEVASLAETIQRDHPRVHVLINNAGIGFGPRDSGRALSADGHELRLAVNYLAPVLLTERLLSALIAAAPSRIVNVASAGQQPIDFDDLMLELNYSGTRAYRQSKLALIMWTFDLAERLRGRGVFVNALHPATFMDTSMVRESGIAATSSVDDGADAVLNLARDDTGGRANGEYFDRLRPSRALAQAYDPAAREKLRRATEQLLAPWTPRAGRQPATDTEILRAPRS